MLVCLRVCSLRVCSRVSVGAVGQLVAASVSRTRGRPNQLSSADRQGLGVDTQPQLDRGPHQPSSSSSPSSKSISVCHKRAYTPTCSTDIAGQVQRILHIQPAVI